MEGSGNEGSFWFNQNNYRHLKNAPYFSASAVFILRFIFHISYYRSSADDEKVRNSHPRIK